VERLEFWDSRSITNVPVLSPMSKIRSGLLSSSTTSEMVSAPPTKSMVSVVFHTCLVDTKGKIVFKGHPANRKDLVKDFNDLLEGKEIENAPKAGSGDDEEESKTDDSGSVDAAEAAASVKKFQELSKEHLLKEETKTAAAGMPRAFCVLVVTSKYDCKAKKCVTNMENYHVLVGPQAKIDGMKEILKPFNDQKWKVTVRE